MTEEAHIELLEKISNSRAKIMLSGYESKLYDDYLQKWSKVTLASFAEQHGTREEVLWMNYEQNQQLSLFQAYPEIME